MKSLLQCPGIVNNRVGSPALFQQRQLSRFAIGELLFVPTPCQSSPHTQITGHLNEYDVLAQTVPTRLDHDRRVEHSARHVGLPPPPFQLRGQPLADPRMRQSLKELQLLRTGLPGG